MHKFIFMRVVIDYGLGVIASCRSSAVVTSSPSSSRAGFLCHAVTLYEQTYRAMTGFTALQILVINPLCQCCGVQSVNRTRSELTA